MKPICPGSPLDRYSPRREFLYVGLLGGLGLTLPQFLRQQALGQMKDLPGHEPVAQGIIQIFLPGGIAHQESFDPKSHAPAEYRGPFGAIDTRISGIQFGANLKAGIEKELPATDKAIAALIRDLDRRGRLDTTLVMVTTEFGRSPKINNTGGRDHWPRVFSVMLAGGGVKRGFVHGASDALGGEVDENPVSVADFATTIYHQIGIKAGKELMSPGNRPIEIVDGGEVLDAVLAKKA